MENKPKTATRSVEEEEAQRLEAVRQSKTDYQKIPSWSPDINASPTRLYASGFNLGNGLTADSVTADKGNLKDFDKVLEIIPINAREAHIRYAENATAQKQALSDTYLYLNATNVQTQYPYEPVREGHSHISTLEPGRIVLDGDKWQMIDKIQVRFDTLTPEQSLAQAAAISQVNVPLTATIEPTLENQRSTGKLPVLEEQPLTPKGVELNPTLDIKVEPERQPVAEKEPVIEKGPVVEKESVIKEEPAVEKIPIAEKEPAVEKVPVAEKEPAAGILLNEGTPEAVKLTPLSAEKARVEQIKESFYEAMIPEEFQELRSFLRNDGFLSNEEVNTALRDSRLERDELAQKLSDNKLPSENKALQEKLTDYLWELHLSIKDPALEKVRADQLYKVETLQPIPDAARKPGAEEDQAQQKTIDRGIQIINGGLIANFLHNYKKAQTPKEAPKNELEMKTRYQFKDVEASLGKMGLTREILSESGNLERLLKGEKTGIIDFKSEYNGQETALRGKIYLVRQGEEVKPYFQSVKQQLQVPEKYLGYTFSQEDKDQLKQKGELGKLVELDDQYSKKKFKAYVGVDAETNSLTVWRADRVHIPLTIKGITLTKEQQGTLEQGGAIRLTGLTSENGQKFDADVQVAAGKRSLGFSPPSEAIKQTLDVKTAKELARSADQLQGTTTGIATTKDRLPEQKQRKAEAKEKGIDPEIAKQDGPVTKPAVAKSQDKNKKAQKDLSRGM